MTTISTDIANQFDHGRKSGIGTTAVPLVATSIDATRGVQIKAAADNAGTVYVGNSDVTADAADATDGFPLAAGEGLFVPLRDPSDVYVLGSEAGQKVFFFIV